MGRAARFRRSAAVAAAAAAVLGGCASTQQPEVERVATAFEDPAGDPETRCDLLTPAALSALEEQASQPCDEAIEDLPLEGGEVESVEVWGGDAQVRLSGDTLFLAETSTGWRVAAAACQPNGEAPYDCEVEP
ncbi:MAG TPA: hypothetical protein VK402_09745 [Blastococcus sp.]|nr:hypothetical protein [Blastococcus sp.]